MKKVVSFLLQMTAVVLGLAQDTAFSVLDEPQTVTFQADSGIVRYSMEGSRNVSGVAAAGFPITLDLAQRGDWLTLKYYPQGQIQDSVLPVPLGPLGRVEYNMVRVPLPDSMRPPSPPDTANLLRDLSWRHILYDAKGNFENYADTLLRANTYQVPGVHAHTPQIVASGWPATEGDSMYAQFQVRGTIDAFRLDINTGPTGPESWAFHFTDTFPVTSDWTRHTAAFQSQYTDEDNRFDFNIGIDTGQVEFRRVSLRRSYVAAPIVADDDLPVIDYEPCDTVYLTQTDTLYLSQLDTVKIRDTVLLRDTLTLPPPPPDTLYLTQTDTLYIDRTDTLYLDRIDTLYLKPDVYLIQEIDGQEVGRTQINN